MIEFAELAEIIMKKLEDDRELFSLVGEYYVLFRLAQLGVRAYKLNDRFDYDLMTTSNIKIEVKASHRQTRKDYWVRKDNTRKERETWTFSNHATLSQWRKGVGKRRLVERYRTCDYYVLVCGGTDNESIEACYIIPVAEFTTSLNLRIPVKGKSIWHQYRNKWDLIIKDNDSRINEINEKGEQIKYNKGVYPKDTYSTGEVAEILGTDRNYVVVWCAENLIDFEKLEKGRNKPVYRITQIGLQQAEEIMKRGEKSKIFHNRYKRLEMEDNLTPLDTPIIS